MLPIMSTSDGSRRGIPGSRARAMRCRGDRPSTRPNNCTDKRKQASRTHRLGRARTRTDMDKHTGVDRRDARKRVRRHTPRIEPRRQP